MLCCLIVAQTGSNFTPADTLRRVSGRYNQAVLCFLQVGMITKLAAHITAAGGRKPKKKKLLNACFSGAMKKILEKIYCHSLKNHFNIFFPTQHHQSYKDPDMERRGVLRKCPRKSSLYCDYLFMKIFLSRCC